MKSRVRNGFQLRPLAWLCIAALLVCVVCMLSLKAPVAKVRTALDGMQVNSCRNVPWLAWTHACHGMALLELADDPGTAQTLVSALYPAPGALDAAIHQTELDYFFILSYAAFLCLWSINVAHRADELQRQRTRAVLLCVAVLQPIAGVLDGFENIGLFSMLTTGTVTGGVHAWTLGVSTAKWWLLALGLLAPIAGWLYLQFAGEKRGRDAASPRRTTA